MKSRAERVILRVIEGNKDLIVEAFLEELKSELGNVLHIVGRGDAEKVIYLKQVKSQMFDSEGSDGNVA